MATDGSSPIAKKGCGFLIFALLALILGTYIYSSIIESAARKESLQLLNTAEHLYSQGKLDESIATASKALAVPNLASADSQEAQRKLNGLLQARDSEKTGPLLAAAQNALNAGDLDSTIEALGKAVPFLRSNQAEQIRSLAQKCRYAMSDDGIGDILALLTQEECDVFCKEGRLPDRTLAPDLDSEAAFRITLPKAQGKAADLRKKGLQHIEEKKVANEKLRVQQLMAQPVEQLKSTVTATVIEKEAVLWEKADAGSKKLGAMPKGVSPLVERTEVKELANNKGRTLKQFFHAVQYRGRSGFLASWEANLQVEFPDCGVKFRVENLIDPIAGSGPTADLVVNGDGAPERAVLDLLGRWSIKNGITLAAVYAEPAKGKKVSGKEPTKRETLCRLECGRVITKEEAAREDAEKKAVAEKDEAQHNLLKDRLGKFMAKLNAVQKESGQSLVSDVKVEVIGDSWTATLTVATEWHLSHYQIRLQSAQGIWNIWASIASPEKPDLARISIRDQMGNEVGGSRILGGSLIWVQKE